MWWAPTPTRRHNSLSPESARRAAAHGLRLPGEAQPMSVRRCTHRRRHPPHWPAQLVLEEPRADPHWPKASCKASNCVLLHLRLRLRLRLKLVVSARHGLGISRRSPWIEVRTQFRPRVRTKPRTFFHLGKSAKNPLKRLIRSTSTNVRRRGRSRWTLSWEETLKTSTTWNQKVNGICSTKRCWTLSFPVVLEILK